MRRGSKSKAAARNEAVAICVSGVVGHINNHAGTAEFRPAVIDWLRTKGEVGQFIVGIVAGYKPEELMLMRGWSPSEAVRIEDEANRMFLEEEALHGMKKVYNRAFRAATVYKGAAV